MTEKTETPTPVSKETTMTEETAMKQMENAIAGITREAVRPQPQSLRQAAPGLDAARLVELARDRLMFARTKLTEVKRDHQLKMFEIDVAYQQRLDEAHRERENAILQLEQQTTETAKPAQDMIALVEKMLS